MTGTVKGATKIGIDDRREALRLQLVASELAARIGRRLRQRRKELGLTQKQVAAKMPSEAVDAQRVSDWERGYNKPSERYLRELVPALEVPDVSYFYEDPERPTGESPLDAFSGANGNGGQLDRIEERVGEIEQQVSEIRGLLVGDEKDAELVAGLAARLLQAAGLPQPGVDEPPATPPGVEQRETA